MSDHFTTQYNHKKTVIELVHSLKYWTFQSKYTFDQYLQAKNERIYEHNSYKRLTRYNRSYIQALLDDMFNELMKNTELRYLYNGVYADCNTHMENNNIKPNSDDSYNFYMAIGDKSLSQPASFWKNSDKVFRPYNQDEW